MVAGVKKYKSDIIVQSDVKPKYYEIVSVNEHNKLPINPYLPSPSKKETSTDFILDADSGVVIDFASKDILFSKNPDQIRPIASITKLMTALIFLDTKPQLSKIYTVKDSDRREGGKIYVFTGEKISAKNLFYISLVASGNTETRALVSLSGLTEEVFVKLMNQKAKDLGLYSTHFEDATGLNEKNVSTAREISQLARVALSNELISDAVTSPSYKFSTVGGRSDIVYSTDDLLGKNNIGDIKVLGGKTGYLGAAGYCFVGKFKNREGREVISVILGASNVESRFTKTEDMVKWVYNNYQWF